MIRPKSRRRLTGFEQAMERWLSGEMSGHFGPFMYTDDADDHRWKEGHSGETYYLGRDDKATFDIMLRELDIEVENFFDLGPGGTASVTSKSLPMLARIKAKRYLPVDLSTIMAQGALDLTRARLGIDGTPLIADFFEPMAARLPRSLVGLPGGTVGNLETHDTSSVLKARLIRIFKNYRLLTARDGYFVVSFDANTDEHEIVACYANDAFGGLVRSCIDRGINTTGFDYDVRWTPDNYQLATGLRARRAQKLLFNERSFSFEKGEFLPVLNSYRFPVPFMITAAAEAGWTHQKIWSATGRVHYVLFKTGKKSKATWRLNNESQPAARTARIAHRRRAGKTAALKNT